MHFGLKRIDIKFKIFINLPTVQYIIHGTFQLNLVILSHKLTYHNKIILNIT